MPAKKSANRAADWNEEDRQPQSPTSPVKIDPSKLRRRKKEEDEEEQPELPPQVAWEIKAKAIDLAFNPTDDALPSFTVIDKFQGRLFPLIDLINTIWDDILQVASYRQDKDEFKRQYGYPRPKSANWLRGLLISTARWQKSIGGTNLTKITDIALAEMETGDGNEGDLGGADAWGKE